MLSPETTVEVIDNFCAVYTDYVEKIDNNEEISHELEDEFKMSLAALGICLREELRRFNEKESKKIKQLKKELYKK